MAISAIQLIPILELTPGQVGAIRNEIINNLVKQASAEMRLPDSGLIVRDVLPVTDLQLYSTGTTAATIEDWMYTATSAAVGYTSISGTKSMGDMRYVALFGIRDLRNGLGPHATATVNTTQATLNQTVTFVKINVGGSDKAIWDITPTQSYAQYPVAFSPSAVIIPQNASFNISYYCANVTAINEVRLQLVGVTVEPRGKTISP